MLADPTSRASIINAPPVPPGLVDFYKFMEMVDQPMLLGQLENRHHIYYRSRVFPGIHLEGYFVGETPISFFLKYIHFKTVIIACFISIDSPFLNAYFLFFPPHPLPVLPESANEDKHNSAGVCTGLAAGIR
jgi:hypothetical protein